MGKGLFGPRLEVPPELGPQAPDPVAEPPSRVFELLTILNVDFCGDLELFIGTSRCMKANKSN